MLPIFLLMPVPFFSLSNLHFEQKATGLEPPTSLPTHNFTILSPIPTPWAYLVKFLCLWSWFNFYLQELIQSQTAGNNHHSNQSTNNFYNKILNSTLTKPCLLWNDWFGGAKQATYRQEFVDWPSSLALPGLEISWSGTLQPGASQALNSRMDFPSGW